ncbi:MarR family winged helix-turn-helix transcriptional regulator [Sphingomonas solaris]|uniref:MarR family transcriptional regulator n=1 Tax=Alterirhizorhabdus solaris TaxID=2529389 RepID=A0A558RB64_9SPHN|nr:MarR family transcriptional regulator [Sphingomonas solaris]TVV76604.1 MarR family transcriptional regulator [Sphingomonas solaris]
MAALPPAVEDAPEQVLPDNRHPRSIGLKITVLARQMRQCFDERVGEIGVTRAQWSLIAAVARNPGATQRTIATQLEVTDVTAGRMIDRICSDGLLERREHPTDRRAYCVYLTPAAQPVLQKLMAVAEEHEQALFASLEKADVDRLNELLDTLSHNVAMLRGIGRPRP